MVVVGLVVVVVVKAVGEVEVGENRHTSASLRFAPCRRIIHTALA